MSKPSIPKGTRDFGPKEMARRKYIFSVIEDVFKLFGFMPLETPAMENLSTLTGKYGDEGDKLLFKILNSGDFAASVDENNWAEKNPIKLTRFISEKGLRYDLTVPFARYVVMNQNEIAYPFKRYQMQPVWRADRPQKGRYREFWQCDADVVGSNSLLCEAELMVIFSTVFERLGIPVNIHVNNRKLLEGIAEIIGAKDKFIPFTTILDKLDKIGWEKVNSELDAHGINSTAFNNMRELMEAHPLPDFENKILPLWSNILSDSEKGKAGLDEILQLYRFLKNENAVANIVLDTTLARGLSYYTGSIFEVKPNNISIGSIAAGGRYDDLTGIFGLKGVSGVGISFGADRIYDVLNEMNLFPDKSTSFTKIIICTLDEDSLLFALPLAKSLRDSNIPTEIYPSASAKLKKQLDYANAKNIDFAIIIGESERIEKNVSVKNLITGEQQTISTKNLSSFFSSKF